MNELESGFILQSTADLRIILDRFQTNKFADFSANRLRELFRALHTIKGTAQTFGFSASANLAHSLENLVAAATTDAKFSAEYKSLLREGIALLIDSFAAKNFQIPPSFAAKIKPFQTESEPRDSGENYFDEIPAVVVAQLSAQEKSNLHAALENGGNLFILEIGFDFVGFAEQFKNFRENLSKKGEIIATLPCSKFSARKKIGFQIVFASRENIRAFAENYAAEVVFENNRKFSESLPGVLAKIVGHGKSVARTLDKTIEFVVFADDFTAPPQVLKLIFDALLHLVRNAVSHAIDEKGRIEIDLKTAADGIFVVVSDDGKGLDAEKIKVKAIEKNLKTSVADLSEAEIAELIFLPEFSTAETLSTISGRGIGLDAVKDSVTNAGGKISVKTEKNKGTTFEIFLPKNF